MKWEATNQGIVDPTNFIKELRNAVDILEARIIALENENKQLKSEITTLRVTGGGTNYSDR